MNTQEISKLLSSDPLTQTVFKGVYPVDKVPIVDLGAYIVNTDESNLPGKHWVCIFKTKSNIEYYDSYGLKPSQIFESILGNTFNYNAERVQSMLSTVCGQHCIYYVLQRSRNVSMQEIINEFDTNYLQNDILVQEIINQRYNLDLELFNTNMLHIYFPNFKYIQIASSQKS
jgi:hypothetical protein